MPLSFVLNLNPPQKKPQGLVQKESVSKGLLSQKTKHNNDVNRTVDTMLMLGLFSHKNKHKTDVNKIVFVMLTLGLLCHKNKYKTHVN